MTMGPQLGVFTMGILMPWVDGTVSETLTRLLITHTHWGLELLNTNS